MKIQDIELDWLGHSAFKIKTKNKVIFIDPFQISDKDKADLILLTHSHYDHCSFQDIDKIAKDGTIIICTADSQSKIMRVSKKIEIVLVEPGKEVSFSDINIKTINAYNTSKPFHPKSEGWVGYIIFCGETAIYHAGDTDFIKEMASLEEYSKKFYLIALLPVDGKFNMNSQEAFKAASIIKPSLALPMHYGSVAGTESDAKKFVELCQEKGINAEMLEKN
jgi:L-ascorbate metabolism protein UlaG (beta-lactamase superfamily)